MCQVLYVACQRCPVLNRPVAESWLYLACFARNRVTTAACLHALNRLRAEVDTDDANVGVDVQQRHRCAASPAADVQERARATGATQVLALKLRKRLCNVVPACVQFTSTGRTPASRPCEFIGNAHAHLGLKKRASWQEKNRSQYAPASFSSSSACLPRIRCSRGSKAHRPTVTHVPSGQGRRRCGAPRRYCVQRRPVPAIQSRASGACIFFPRSWRGAHGELVCRIH